MNLCKSVESVGVFFMSHGFHRFTQIFSESVYHKEKVQFHCFGIEPFLIDKYLLIPDICVNQ